MPATDLVKESDLESNKSVVFVLDFWADWSSPCGPLNTVFDQLADSFNSNNNLKFYKVEAEKFPDITDKYDINAVPSFVFLKNGKLLDKVEGANAPELASKVSKYSQLKEETPVVAASAASTSAKSAPSNPQPSAAEDLNTRLKKLINQSPAVLFMKGTPEAPECGFSRKIVDILKQNKIEFSSFNILKDETVRNGLKTFSNWPTYPQFYVNGNLIGGLDIVKELAEDGELAALMPKSMDDRLKALINEAPVMLFMKGSSENPQCGFSRKIVEILKNANVEFKSFNILEDEEVRSGLKVLSNWPTYPQLYSKGKLIGGLDIVKELAEDGELADALA